jgi:hypothetical protein
MQQAQLGRFGDRRLAAAGDALLAAMQRQRTMCLAALAADRAEQQRFSSFLDHEAVTRHEMLTQAGRLTAARVAGRHVLVVNDTSEFNFAAHAGRKYGFGTVGNGSDIGVFVHPSIAVDADSGGVIGLVGAEVINRTGGRVETTKTRPADEKESRRWLAAAETAGDVLAAAVMITMVEDREGDIYDQFARRPANVNLLVRAAQNRNVGADGHLFEHCAAWPVAAQYTIAVPAKRNGHGQTWRPERTTEVAVRFGEVQIRRPSGADKSLAPTLTLRVVDVREVNPPADAKERIHWCLLTTHEVRTAAAAMQIVAWYRLRWIVEQVFRTMKTDGVAVETSQITTPASLLKLVMVALIAAIRVMQLVIGRDGGTGQKLTEVIADPDQLPALQAINATLEGRTEKLKNPFDPDSLAWIAWIAARLGGWSGYTSKGYRPPGPKTIARGLKRLDAMVEGWMLGNGSGVVRDHSGLT